MKITQVLKSSFRMAAVQFGIKPGKQVNLDRAKQGIEDAIQYGPDLVCIPENFSFHPLGNKYVIKYAEDAVTGETSKLLSSLAKKHKIYLLGGSIPEVENGKYYNTALAYDPEGNIIMKYQKNHLFDVDVPGKMTYSESSTVTPGDDIGIMETPFGKFGVALCYDLRFPLLASVYASKGCKMLLYPSVFSTFTGPLHWEVLQRARAIDNQVFVATISPSRDESANYVVWGHSMIVDPWGNILKKAGIHDETLVIDIDLSVVDQAREQLPVLRDSRNDLYRVVSNI